MTAIQSLPRAPHAVRPLPFPYLGAAALSFDAEYLDFPFFETLMRFLNTRGPTPFGPGLGLEVTSSLFFFSGRREHFSYFDGLAPDAPASTAAPRLDDYLRAGWLDANHAFGDFSQQGGFARAHALRAYERLERLGVRLPVFTNHGSENNVQNVGRDRAYHQGDVPGAAAYHADLFAQAGVRHVWTDSMVNEMTPGGPLARLRAVVRRGRGALGRQALNARRLCFPCELADGGLVSGFHRFRSTGGVAPNLGNLGAQLALVPWGRLYAASGCVVVYQHPGLLGKTARGFVRAGVEPVAARAGELLSPLRFLAGERDAGRLWVSGLARLLGYADMLSRVRLDRAGPGALDVSGGDPDLAPSRRYGGLTVYDPGGRGLRLLCQGRELRTVANAPDGTGRPSVTVPLAPLEDIWG